MKPIHSVLAVAVALTVGFLPHASAATFTFTPTSSTTVTQGGTVTFDIYGSSVNDIAGYSLFLKSTDAGTDLQITNQTLTSNFTYAGAFPSLPVAVNTTPSEDLGAFANSDLSANTPYLLSTDTLTIGAATPAGFYTIGDDNNAVFSDASGDGDYVTSPTSFTIDVTAAPEPSTWALLLAGAAGLLVLGRIRLAARAGGARF